MCVCVCVCMLKVVESIYIHIITNNYSDFRTIYITYR